VGPSRLRLRFLLLRRTVAAAARIGRVPMTANQGSSAGRPPASPTAHGAPRPDAFDLWLRGALRELFGPVADEPVPEALRRLVGAKTPAPAPQPRQRQQRQ
jgi:hypothetical protein